MNQRVDRLGEDAAEATGTARLTFLRQFLISPRSTASIAPSGKYLADLMASTMPVNTRRVIELGAGTGVITDALIRRGIAPQDLFVIEMNPGLHKLLRVRFSAVNIVCGDACELQSLSSSWRDGQPAVDAVVSSLGLLAMPKEIRHEILASAFKVLPLEGVFVQYTYGFTCPIGAEIRQRLGLTYECSGSVLRNLPPARVYVYRRSAVSATSTRGRVESNE